MYIIELDEIFYLKSIGETDENGDTPLQVTTVQGEALGFKTRQDAEDANSRFDLCGEIRDIV